MKKQLLCTMALVALAGCEQEQSAATVAEQEQSAATVAEQAAPLQSGIDIASMDTSVRPGDDFFSYVNGT